MDFVIGLGCPLGEAEVVTTSCDGLEHLLTENVVALILRYIELCVAVSKSYHAENKQDNTYG